MEHALEVLADRTVARSIIAYWHDIVSVCNAVHCGLWRSGLACAVEVESCTIVFLAISQQQLSFLFYLLTLGSVPQ